MNVTNEVLDNSTTVHRCESPVEQYAGASWKQDGGRAAGNIGENAVSDRVQAIHIHEREFAKVSGDRKSGWNRTEITIAINLAIVQSRHLILEYSSPDGERSSDRFINEETSGLVM